MPFFIMDPQYYSSTSSESAEYHTSFDYPPVSEGFSAWPATARPPCFEQQTPASSSEPGHSWQTLPPQPHQVQQYPPHYETYQFNEQQLSTPPTGNWSTVRSVYPHQQEHYHAEVPRTVESENPYPGFTNYLEPSQFDATPTIMPTSEDAVYPEQPRRASTFRSRLSYEARAILDRWFDEHRSDPYLEKAEAEQLATETGLTVRQVRTYFANARARKLPPTPVTESSGETYSPAHAAETTRGSIDREDPSHPLQRRRRWVPIEPDARRDEESPMERFLRSSPDEEAVPEDVVKTAAATLEEKRRDSAESYQSKTKKRRKSWRNDVRSDVGHSHPASPSSHSSVDSTANRGPRRGRKRQPDNFRLPQTKVVVRSPPDPKKIYQCTFCARDFSHKYDWRRHEESVHFPQQEWICMPDNQPVIIMANGAVHCAFCDLPDPTPAHLEAHNCSGCLSTPRAHRVFTRKDKLLQHIGQVHKQSSAPRHLQNWCRPVERDVAFWCGICGLRLNSWQERVDHISGHFAIGQDMRYWRGEPGNVQLGASEAVSPLTMDPNRNGYPASVASFDQSYPGPHICSMGCVEHFDNYTELVFHERQKHTLYRDAAMLSPTAGLQVSQPAPYHIGAGYPSIASATAMTHTPPNALPVLPQQEPMSYFPEYSPARVAASTMLAPQFDMQPSYDVAFDSYIQQGLSPPMGRSSLPIRSSWSRRESVAAHRRSGSGLPGSAVSSRRGS